MSYYSYNRVDNFFDRMDDMHDETEAHMDAHREVMYDRMGSFFGGGFFTPPFGLSGSHFPGPRIAPEPRYVSGYAGRSYHFESHFNAVRSSSYGYGYGYVDEYVDYDGYDAGYDVTQYRSGHYRARHAPDREPSHNSPSAQEQLEASSQHDARHLCRQCDKGERYTWYPGKCEDNMDTRPSSGYVKPKPKLAPKPKPLVPIKTNVGTKLWEDTVDGWEMKNWEDFAMKKAYEERDNIVEASKPKPEEKPQGKKKK